MACQRTSVVSAEESGKWLTDNCPDDRNMRPDVRTALSKVYTPLDILEAKLKERKSKLENAVMRGQEFDKSFNDITDRVSSIEFQLHRQKAVSADWSEVVKQQQDQKTLVKEIISLKYLYDQLIDSAINVIKSLEPGDEKDATEQKVDEIKKQWEDISSKVQHRNDLIDQVEPAAHAHFNEKQAFVEWIVEPENAMKDLEQVPTTREDQYKFRKAVKDFVNDVENHILKHDVLNESKDKLSTLIKKHPDETSGLSDVEEDVDRINRRWDRLENHTHVCKEKVDKLQVVIVKYYDDYNKADKVLEDLEHALEYEPTYGVDEEQGKKELSRMEDLLKVIDQAKDIVHSTCDYSKDLEDVVDDYDGNNAPVKDSTKRLTKRLKDVQEQLNARKLEIEKKNKVLAQFLASSDDLEKWYMATTQALVSVGSVKPNPEQVKEQLEAVDVSTCIILCLFRYLKGRNFGGNLIWRLAKSAYLAGI